MESELDSGNKLGIITYYVQFGPLNIIFHSSFLLIRRLHYGIFKYNCWIQMMCKLSCKQNLTISCHLLAQVGLPAYPYPTTAVATDRPQSWPLHSPSTDTGHDQ